MSSMTAVAVADTLATLESPSRIPVAILRRTESLPMVELGPGVSVQLLQVDLDHNIRITRSLLAPGLALRRHTHSGHVFAWTLAGTWKYREHAESSVANSFLYEPAGSSHTLTVPADSPEPADVVFIVHGTNIDHNEDGSIHSALDAAGIARVYLHRCRELRLPRPAVIGLPPDFR